MQIPKQYICTISKVIDETKMVKTFRLDLPNNSTIDFIPGQFIIISFLNALNGVSNLKRSYSISSQPNYNQFVEITLGAHGPFTQAMFKLRVGDKLNVQGPFGKFNLPLDFKGDLALFSGGTGIAPIMSIIRYITENNLKNDIKLLYSVKRPNEIIYNIELLRRQKEFENFEFIPTITRLEEDDIWDGSSGRINVDMIKKHIPNITKRTSYICGPNEFVRGIVEMLTALGIDDINIKREAW